LCYRLLKRFSDENGGEGSWIIRYSKGKKALVPWMYITYSPLEVSFTSKEICQQAIEKFRPQIMAAMGV